MNDLFHKVSKFIINYCVYNKTANIIIGYNKGWKESIHMNKANKQTFKYISFLKLIEFIKYKAQLVGIKVITLNESYTSKCDALNEEKICFHDTYSGQRVKRGLFKSEIGKVINADINGAINILRKYIAENVVGESFNLKKIIDSGLLFNPIKFNDLYSLSFRPI